jgi:hypothetical protein
MLENRESVVASVLASCQEKGLSLSGPCGAFEVVKRVAWALRGEGYGLLYKGGGENCQGYDTSSVMRPNGEHWDILEDAGGKNRPQWNRVEYTADRPVEGHATGDPLLRPEMYRPAIDPGDETPHNQIPANAGEPGIVGDIWRFCQSAAPSMDKGHQELRLIGQALGCMDADGNATTGPNRLDLLEQAIANARGDELKLTPDMVSAALPMLQVMISQAVAAWMKANDVARITLTPKKQP